MTTKPSEPVTLDDILAEQEEPDVTEDGEITGLIKRPTMYLGVRAEVLPDLRSGTPASEVKQRPTFRKVGGKSVKGPMLSYVDARYVMDRLDDVVGPENWSTEQQVLPDGSVVTRLTIRVVDGEVTTLVTKSDVGVPSTIEPMKGAFSDSFKRAAVHWGIARDLYEDREDEMAEPAPAAPIRARFAGDDEDVPTSRPTYSGPRRAAAPGRYTSRPTNGGAPGRTLEDKEAAYNLFLESFDPEDSPWYCPDHNTVTLMPPGISKRTGGAYGGKLVCTERGCQNGGPWIEDVLSAAR